MSKVFCFKFFSSALQSSQSTVDALHLPVTDVFDLIEELDSFCPALLDFVYPQLLSALKVQPLLHFSCFIVIIFQNELPFNCGQPFLWLASNL